MKVFGIGWAKTGTTTLKRCFEILGYSHYGYNINLVGRPDQAIAIAERFETFQDWPWTLYYKELDQAFPGSKFVLTMRNTYRWIKSYRNALSKLKPPSPTLSEARRTIYGFDPFDATDYQLIERYSQHCSEVLFYFDQRPEDVLLVDWERGDNWKMLCQFLEKPVPEKPFPHENKGDYDAI